VEILHTNGFDARILHHKDGYVSEWFQSPAPVDYWTEEYKFHADDVLVIPEGHVDVMRAAQELPCKRVIIALNWGNIFRGLRIGENWRSFGASAIIAGSQYEHDFILSAMGLESTVIVSGIDSELFAPTAKEKLFVTYMPRKNSEYFRLILSVFRSKFKQYIDIPFVGIDMRPHREVAGILAASSVFLAHTFPEGLSRKTLEAMACGNIVVGFAGHGSLECMDDTINCYKVEDGDILAAAEHLAVAIDDIHSGKAGAMQCAAVKTAAKYSLAREELTVLQFWASFLGLTAPV
jgi:glycosyltransferase involved in cell wall biosynthesis